MKKEYRIKKDILFDCGIHICLGSGDKSKPYWIWLSCGEDFGEGLNIEENFKTQEDAIDAGWKIKKQFDGFHKYKDDIMEKIKDLHGFKLKD